MRDLNTTPLNRPAPWLPSFDVHEENGELVLHADLEEADISLDGGDLVVQADGRSSRMRLPFAPSSLRSKSQSCEPARRGMTCSFVPA